MGSAGILGYLLTTTEQIVLVHFLKTLLKIKPSTLSHVMFIKDGPLAFFGQTANIHQPMRSLVRFLFKEHNLFLAGLEKSGTFVEHAHAMASLMQPSQMLLLDNEYIYKYIIPGKANSTSPYGRTTYYGNKIIFKSSTGGMHVVTLPTKDVLAAPKAEDSQYIFRNEHHRKSALRHVRQCTDPNRFGKQAGFFGGSSEFQNLGAVRQGARRRG